MNETQSAVLIIWSQIYLYIQNCNLHIKLYDHVMQTPFIDYIYVVEVGVFLIRKQEKYINSA